MKKRLKSVTSSTLIPNLVFNERANSFKSSETGFSVEIFLGEISTAQECGQNKPVIVANSDGAVHYVRFGDDTVVAPTGLSDGILVPPNNFIVLASGLDTHVISDSNMVGAYVAYEDISDAEDQPEV